MSAPIRKVLVANRGEIALRVFRTCRDLGIATVAVAERDDRGSLHTRGAGEVVEISSYLDPSEHVRAARETGADAVHPGYGFLAESDELAEAVEAAGLTWIGPPPSALRRGGDKLEAKEIARGAGVPVVETGDAAEIGFPLLVKAAAGGGGRGMRVVRSEDELESSLEAARREALAAFGDDTVFCERWVEGARHVEVQLMADAHGMVRALGERECSVQRRHQKVLEESPSPGIDETVRDGLFRAAESFAAAIGYRSAGTAEFLVGTDGQIIGRYAECDTGAVPLEFHRDEASEEGRNIARQEFRLDRLLTLGLAYRLDLANELTPGWGEGGARWDIGQALVTSTGSVSCKRHRRAQAHSACQQDLASPPKPHQTPHALPVRMNYRVPG